MARQYKAQALLYKSQFNLALEEADRVLNNQPDNTSALLTKGECHYHLCQVKRSVSIAEMLWTFWHDCSWFANIFISVLKNEKWNDMFPISLGSTILHFLDLFIICNVNKYIKKV